MNPGASSKSLITLFAVSIAIISWQEIKYAESPIGWPRPSRFVALGVAYSLLSILADTASPRLASVIAAGLTLGLVINTMQAGKQSSNTATATPVATGSGGSSNPSTGTGLTTGIQV